MQYNSKICWMTNEEVLPRKKLKYTSQINYTPAVNLPACFGCRIGSNPGGYTTTVGVRGLEAPR